MTALYDNGDGAVDDAMIMSTTVIQTGEGKGNHHEHRIGIIIQVEPLARG